MTQLANYIKHITTNTAVREPSTDLYPNMFLSFSLVFYLSSFYISYSQYLLGSHPTFCCICTHTKYNDNKNLEYRTYIKTKILLLYSTVLVCFLI